MLKGGSFEDMYNLNTDVLKAWSVWTVNVWSCGCLTCCEFEDLILVVLWKIEVMLFAMLDGWHFQFPKNVSEFECWSFEMFNFQVFKWWSIDFPFSNFDVSECWGVEASSVSFVLKCCSV